jgi:hypothetical protein
MTYLCLSLLVCLCTVLAFVCTHDQFYFQIPIASCCNAVQCPIKSIWRMASSGMLRRVALVRTNASEELSASFIRVTRICELGATLAVTSNRRSVRRLLVTPSDVPSSPILVTLMKESLSSSETSVLRRATQRNIPEDSILHSHCRENLKSYRTSLYFHTDLHWLSKKSWVWSGVHSASWR